MIIDFNREGERYIQNHYTRHTPPLSPNVKFGTKDQLLYKRWCRPFWTPWGSLVMTAGRVYLLPIPVFTELIIDRLACCWSAVATGNTRIGLYSDNGAIPDGGALVVESGSIAKTGTNRIQEILVADTLLTPRLYWLGLEGDDASQVINIAVNYLTETGVAGTLRGRYYDRAGGYGPFTGPCPATVADVAVEWGYMRVKV